MSIEIFREAMRVMGWAYGWSAAEDGEGLVVSSGLASGWTMELGRFNGSPPRLGDRLALSGCGETVVVAAALFDRGWKIRIELAVGDWTAQALAKARSE